MEGVWDEVLIPSECTNPTTQEQDHTVFWGKHLLCDLCWELPPGSIKGQKNGAKASSHTGSRVCLHQRFGSVHFLQPNCSVDNREVHVPASSGQHPRLLLHSAEVSTFTRIHEYLGGQWQYGQRLCGYSSPQGALGHQRRWKRTSIGWNWKQCSYIVLQSFGRHKRICNILMFLAVQWCTAC